MTSSAFADLGGRLEEVRLLSALDPTRDSESRATAIETRTGNATVRAGIVLLTAHLEGYIEDVVTEALDYVVTELTQVDDIPLLLRALHSEEHLTTLEQTRDRKARAAKIARLHGQELNLWMPGAPVSSAMLRPKMVCAQMSNPGSNEIQAFLELLDLDIRDQLTATGDERLLDGVNGIVARRNAIAHGEVSATATTNDLDVFVVLVEDLCSRLDAEIARRLQDLCHQTSLPW